MSVAYFMDVFGDVFSTFLIYVFDYDKQHFVFESEGVNVLELLSGKYKDYRVVSYFSDSNALYIKDI